MAYAQILLKIAKKLLYIEIWFGGHFEFMQIRALKVGNFGETFYVMFIEVQWTYARQKTFCCNLF